MRAVFVAKSFVHFDAGEICTCHPNGPSGNMSRTRTAQGFKSPHCARLCKEEKEEEEEGLNETEAQ